jgi:hypothetical protein
LKPAAGRAIMRAARLPEWPRGAADPRRRSPAMKKPAALVLALVLLLSLPAVVRAAASDPWVRLRFLLGEWEGTGNGEPGLGSGGANFALELDGKILVRHSRADYPATATAAAIAHRDLMVVYPGASDSLFRAIYFDNEGHVIQYHVLAPAPGGHAIFDSEGAETGPRFRLTCDSTAGDGLEVGFWTAPPGGELKRHVGGTLRRGAPASKH